MRETGKIRKASQDDNLRVLLQYQKDGSCDMAEHPQRMGCREFDLASRSSLKPK